MPHPRFPMPHRQSGKPLAAIAQGGSGDGPLTPADYETAALQLDTCAEVLRTGGLASPTAAVTHFAMTLVAQLAQSVSSMGVGGAGATQQIIFQIDSRTIAQAAVQGMPPIVRVSAGLRGM
jgi:hypothetical protein